MKKPRPQDTRLSMQINYSYEWQSHMNVYVFFSPQCHCFP